MTDYPPGLTLRPIVAWPGAETAMRIRAPFQADWSRTLDLLGRELLHLGGIGTVPVRALKLGRRGRAVELNPGYYLDAVKYLQAAERDSNLPTLFDLIEEGA